VTDACQACAGRGYHLCPKCEGKGFYYKVKEKPSPHSRLEELTPLEWRSSIDFEEKCSICKGKGKFECPVCDSTGQETNKIST
jgi:RecJ-like exonuclease